MHKKVIAVIATITETTATAREAMVAAVELLAAAVQVGLPLNRAAELLDTAIQGLGSSHAPMASVKPVFSSARISTSPIASLVPMATPISNTSKVTPVANYSSTTGANLGLRFSDGKSLTGLGQFLRKLQELADWQTLMSIFARFLQSRETQTVEADEKHTNKIAKLKIITMKVLKSLLSFKEIAFNPLGEKIAIRTTTPFAIPPLEDPHPI